MNINQFRLDLEAAVEASGKSVSAIAQERNVQQASLSRFLSGKTSLSGENILALWPFVYGDKRPPAKGSVSLDTRPT